MLAGGTKAWILWTALNTNPPPGARSSIRRLTSSRTFSGASNGRTRCVSTPPPQKMTSLHPAAPPVDHGPIVAVIEDLDARDMGRRKLDHPRVDAKPVEEILGEVRQLLDLVVDLDVLHRKTEMLPQWDVRRFGDRRHDRGSQVDGNPIRLLVAQGDLHALARCHASLPRDRSGRETVLATSRRRCGSLLVSHHVSTRRARSPSGRTPPRSPGVSRTRGSRRSGG